MLTKELAIGMMRQANSGEQMLQISDVIASMMEDQNIEDAANHYDELNAVAELDADPFMPQDEVEVEPNPMDDFNYVGSPAHY